MSEEYVPFGDEWKKHVAKLPKRELIDMLSEALRGKQEAQLELLREQQSRPAPRALDGACACDHETVHKLITACSECGLPVSPRP